MPLYFAYGSNMNAEAMGRRCPRSKAVGPARLARHRLAVMREGWLTVVRDSRASAHGILWDLALSDVRALDRYEGPLYAKIVQPVLAESGPKRALVYVGANAGPGTLRPDYLAEVLAAARAWPLPAGAIAAIERLGEGPAGAKRYSHARFDGLGEQKAPDPRQVPCSPGFMRFEFPVRPN